MLSTANQVYVFLSTVYAGFIIGFIYDCYRMVRRITKPGKWITGILDLLFWFIMGVLSFLVIFYVNNGEVRIYTIAGFAIGWALYALTLSPIIMKVLQFIYTMVVKIITGLIKMIICPFRLLIKILSYPAHWLKVILTYLVKQIKKLMARITLKKRTKKRDA